VISEKFRGDFPMLPGFPSIADGIPLPVIPKDLPPLPDGILPPIGPPVPPPGGAPPERKGGAIARGGTEPGVSLFRSNRYGVDFPAFAGKELKPIEPGPNYAEKILGKQPEKKMPPKKKQPQ
jgi:hypothetical protein